MTVSVTYGKSPIDVMDLRHVDVFAEESAAIQRMLELTAEMSGWYIQIHDENDNLIMESTPQSSDGDSTGRSDG